MDLRKLIVSSFLLTSSAVHSAVDNQLIQSVDASRITLAGGIGKAAIYAIQADDDDDLEIFATASSTVNWQYDHFFDRGNGNDHWIILDRNAADTDYEIMARGELQHINNMYISSHQINYQKILLGHKGGKLTTLEFIDDPAQPEHTINEITEDTPNAIDGTHYVSDGINSIISLTGTDQNEYVILCSGDKHWAYDVAEKNYIASVDASRNGEGCLAGDIDYQEVNGFQDEELITSRGQVYTFDGSQFIHKPQFDYPIQYYPGHGSTANIDGDPNDEILAQQSQWGPLIYSNGIRWIDMSATQNAKKYFYTHDTNNDGIDEIFFEYIYPDPPHGSKLVQVSWDSDLDSHVVINEVDSPHDDIGNIKYLPTSLVGNVPGNYFLFTSSSTTFYGGQNVPDRIPESPLDPLLSRLNPDLSISWSGLYSTAARDFDVVAKINNDIPANIEDFNLVQLEQVKIDSTNNEYQFSFKKLDLINFDIIETLQPTYGNNEIISISNFVAADINNDGIDEVHAGGMANYLNNAGVVLSSYLDGSDQDRMDINDAKSTSNLFVGNANNQSTLDIFASGETVGETGFTYMYRLDNSSEISGNYKPPGFYLERNKAIPLNVRGDSDLELVGLNNKQIYSYNPNPQAGESEFYQLTNVNITDFLGLQLTNREHAYVLASDETGYLHLVEPQDMDVLASTQACVTPINAIETFKINNSHLAFVVCGQKLKSWVITYDTNNEYSDYAFFELDSYTLGNMITEKGKLKLIETENNLALLGLFKNELLRFTLNTTLFEDPDTDGYLGYQDHFPNEISQWADADLDGLGDNPAPAVNPDPSLNDIDNDGVLDDVDPDNIPENDLNPANDNDHGAPQIVSALADLSISASGELTNVSLTTPSVTDVYHDAEGLGDPAVSASVANVTLTDNTGTFDGDFESGLYSILWTATDDAGNSVSESQKLSIYPIIGFETSTSTIGETQSSQILVTLSGSSPVYPVEVELSVTLGTASNDDVIINTDETITLSFADGETEKTVQIYAVDDGSVESDETLTLTLTDTFAPNEWTVNPAASTHELTIREANRAPVVNVTVSQNGEETDSPTVLDGTVTLQSMVTDANASDTHSYLWNLSSLGLGDSLLENVAFDPSSKAPGLYSISLTVTDNGLPNQVEIHTFNLTLDYGDSDGDGYKDNVDAFPNSITEWSDRDGDGYSDQVGDAFPDLASEYKDSDGDGVGDKADKFDDDPNEQFDADGDGVGDEADQFDNDPNEQFDADGDGVGDNADQFDDDATEQFDTDKDGVGDNSDAFPNDPTETLDSDGDGVGDNADEFPGDPKKSNEAEEESVSTGSLSHLALLLLLGLVYRRRIAN